MPWIELHFVCDAGDADAFSDALLRNGALSVSVEDADAGSANEQPIFGEPGMPPASTWPRSAVVALLDPASDCAVFSRESATRAGLRAVPAFTTRDVEDQDWVRLTQSQFEPIRVSGRLWIVPTWHVAPDPDAIVIRLDPGMAFGTGSHPTTRLCLQWLDRFLRPRQSVLDYGCGSGILAIAASRLGAGSVIATDIDPLALAATRTNAQTNACVVSVEDTSFVHLWPSAVNSAWPLGMPARTVGFWAIVAPAGPADMKASGYCDAINSMSKLLRLRSYPSRKS